MIVSKLRKSISNLFRLETILENKIILNNLKTYSLNSCEIGVSNVMHIDKPIIVSLTTYGKKIYEVYLVIESIFQQTLKANKVVLWLSEKDFSDETLPLLLKKQKERGLDIRYCKDLRSYTKVIYSFEEFKGCHIVSVDDDIVYPVDMLERFVECYKRNKNRIYFNKGHRMLYNRAQNKMEPYLLWVKNGYAAGSSVEYLPLGVYGIFYPDGILNDEVFNQDVFINKCPMADDVWFKAMSLLNNVECEVVERGAVNMNNFISIELNRESALARTNVDKYANDWQIKNIFEHYNLYKYFSDESYKSTDRK